MRSPCTTLPILALALSGLAVGACGDDGSTEDSTVGMGSTGTTTASSASVGSTGESATSVASVGMDSTGPATTATTAPTSMGETTSNTGFDTDSLECYGVDEPTCSANGLCIPIFGAPILMPEGGACLGAREFLNCQATIACGDAITYACADLDAPLYQFLDTCVPEGWIDCGPPPAGELPPC